MNDIFTVTLPDIGEGVVEGQVVEWLKEAGETVKQDEPVVSVVTDKATVELPAPYPGKLTKMHVPVGKMAIRDKPIYDLEVADGVHVMKKAEPRHAASAEPAPKVKRSHHAKTAQAIPAVRRAAREKGIDLDRVTGTGKDGRITMADLRQAVPSAVEIPRFEGDVVEPMIGVRDLVSKKMTLSKSTIPDFTYFDKVEATYLMQFREHAKVKAAEEGIKLTYVGLFVRALSLTLKRFPQFNAAVDGAENAIVTHAVHNIGIAMKTEQGLVVPVLKGVESMSFEETMRSYDALMRKAATGALRSEDMKGSTITLSNFGTEGGLYWATPVINAPEVAILATGRFHKEPVVHGSEMVIRDMLYCSWSFDHRVIDGDMAVAFSRHFNELILSPNRLI